MEPATIRDREGLAGFLRGVLFEDVLPFWSRHGQDEGGGINTCIGDDGSLFSRDKWLWSQWRAVWVYARLFNRHEVYRFATRHGWDRAEEGWVLRVDSDGGVINGCESIYVDGFAMYGLAELYRGTSDPEVRDWLTRTADSVARRLEQPHERIPHFPYPVQPGSRMHGIPMLFSLNFRVAGEDGEALDLGKVGGGVA